MAKFVIKRNGTKEPFDKEKIKKSIAGAVQKAGLSEKQAKKVVKKVSKAAIKIAKKKEEIATTEIREKILSELDALEPSVSAAWREHERTKA